MEEEEEVVVGGNDAKTKEEAAAESAEVREGVEGEARRASSQRERKEE